MTDPQVFLAKMQDASSVMKGTAYALDYLADGIEFVGLPRIVDPLRVNAQVLRKAAEKLDDAIGEMIEHMVISSNEATYNMVSAALAVATAPRGE
jgi:hypothetical protein